MDILRAQTILVSVLYEALACVDHENAGARVGVLLVNHHDAGRDAGAVEEVGRQADDALDQTALDQVFADAGFLVAPEQHTVGQDNRALPRAL